MNKVYMGTLALAAEALKGQKAGSRRAQRWPAMLESLSSEEWKNVYQECRLHGIVALTYECVTQYCSEQKYIDRWLRDAAQQVARYYTLLEEQKQLLLLAGNLHPVIIKGAAAAYCYPNPECRQMGDIDLVILKDNVESGKTLLDGYGYKFLEENRRHFSFGRHGALIELHRRDTDTIEQTEWYDRMDYVVSKAEKVQVVEISGYQVPIFDDAWNGLILLTHLLHHMAGGIGLRQLIDWRMFADRFLTDDYWRKSFQPLVEELKIVEYTKIVTRACQIYLGLRDDITWCQDVELQICDCLIQYVMDQGNFGNKADYNNHSMDVIVRSSGVRKLFINLQKQGSYNWKILKKYPWLTPFAWLYQGIRYIRRGCEQKIGLKELKRERVIRKEMDELLRGMGLE